LKGGKRILGMRAMFAPMGNHHDAIGRA